MFAAEDEDFFEWVVLRFFAMGAEAPSCGTREKSGEDEEDEDAAADMIVRWSRGFGRELREVYM